MNVTTQCNSEPCHLLYRVSTYMQSKSGHGGGRGGGKAPDILNTDKIRRVDSFTIHLVYWFQAV